MISLLAPAALGLIAVAAAPIAIHLLTRRRAQPRAFPALAFLMAAEHGRSRRSRLRDRAVLLLRALAIALAASAVAGPLWQGSFAGGADRPAVIVLDASASMGQVVDGATAFARGRAEAGRLADALAPRPVALVVAGAPLRRSGPEPSSTHGPVRSLLAESSPGWSDGDPAGALAAAGALLPAGGDVFMISDLSRSSLSGVDPASLPAGIDLRLVDVGGGQRAPGNRAVVGLAGEPGIAVAGRPLTITARVANYAATAVVIPVRIQAGATGTLAEVSVPPGEVRAATFTFTPESSGWIAISAEIPGGDALAADDRRHGAIDVQGALAALIVSDGDRDDADGAVRPLAAALAAAGLEVRVTDAAGFAADVSSAAVVVTAGLRSAAPAPRLAARLTAGGAWLHVIAGDADAAIAADQALAGIAPPMGLGDQVDVSAQERGRQSLSSARLDHPLLAAFVGREDLLAAVSAFRYRLTPHGQAADATVALAYADGTLALVERPVGAGRWLTMNLSPAAIDSDLAGSEALPLLISRLPAALLPDRAPALAQDVGAAVASDQPLGDAAGTIPVIDGRVLLPRAGIFRAPGGRLVAAAVRDLESDLRPIDPAVLGLAATAADQAVSAATRTPLWPWLLLAAAALFALELAVAGGVRRRP